MLAQPSNPVAPFFFKRGVRSSRDFYNGKTTQFIWQGDRLIAESAQQQGIRGLAHYRSYLYEPGTFKPLALLDGKGQDAEAYYYQLDHLGTPQELTSRSGHIVWSANYRAYGNVLTLDIADISNPLRFQGQYCDEESGLHYNRHRYYNPNTGRYLTPDPIKLAGGLNSYQYVPNPTGWVDPLGLSSCPTGDRSCNGKIEDHSAKVSVDEAIPSNPEPHLPDKWSRTPKSIQDQMTLQAAKLDEGRAIIKNLKDIRYQGMYKMELKTKSKNGNDSVVHYVKDPTTGEVMDFKFKKHSTDNVKPWGNDPAIPPGE